MRFAFLLLPFWGMCHPAGAHVCVCLDHSNVLCRRWRPFLSHLEYCWHGWLQCFQGKIMDKMDSPLLAQSNQLNVDYFCVFGGFEVCHSVSMFKNY